jgi:hypothetical protein
MNIELKITNSNKKSVITNILCALNCSDDNFGLPSGISISVVNEQTTYEKILQHLTMQPLLICFIESTDNRQLFFYWQDAFGAKGQIEPHLTIDGLVRPKKRVLIDGEFEYEYVKKRNPKEWNIADTHEKPIWNHCSFVELHLKAKQTFILEFTFLKH